MLKNFLAKINNTKTNSGMTFIELIVVIGIFGMIAGVALFNFGGFSSSVTLQNLSNQIALQIKQAQTDSISGKQALLFGTNRPSYGLVFSASQNFNDLVNYKKIAYVADLNNDSEGLLSNCASGAGNECLNNIEIQSSDIISNVCYYDNSWHCSGANSSDELHVFFKRPFPDAMFKFGSFNLTGISRVAIEIQSAKGINKHIVVWKTGQIQVESGKVI